MRDSVRFFLYVSHSTEFSHGLLIRDMQWGGPPSRLAGEQRV